LEMLESYEIEEPNFENLLVLLQKGDEVLDYEEALEVLEGAKMVVEEGGTHSFEGLERHIQSIKRFLGVALKL